MLAQNSQDSHTPANDDCAKLARACTGAARELKAARKLIEGYENQIVAFDARLELARKELESMKELGALEAERAAKLEEVIKAERAAKAALVAIRDEQTKRIASLEKKLSRSRKLTWIVAGVVGVGVAVLVRR